MDVEKLKALGAAVRTGGKGTMRRKKKVAHKAATTDDKKLQATLKRLGVNTIPGIEEVNLYQGDSVINFSNPKVQASIAANTFVVSGPSQTKAMADVMGPSNMQLQQLMAQLGLGGETPDLATLQKMAQQMGAGAAGAGAAGGAEDDDDEVPDLVENFEEAAKA
ncbi:transcription factor BTF3 [Raphidocelis subcapitata]|uniref:Nascent polypeptide-associated complex subunit beta n=1 Tax=Raphidocelis subcapitata TaxID=307507 RepID=A0A2V0NJI4_9CHLO|nr:transcription factor BTF3 [Raphidocelis subcapitata]|eukprot:GBF87374.1 transcription factor BTF3 [Raphidocelis subcapitata]